MTWKTIDRSGLVRSLIVLLALFCIACSAQEEAEPVDSAPDEEMYEEAPPPPESEGAAPPPETTAPKVTPAPPLGAQAVQTCLSRGTCTSVNVLFGTNREIIFGKQVESFNRFSRVEDNPFKEEDAENLTLGEIDITVPVIRDAGTIQTPRRFRIPGTNIEIGQRLNPESHFVFIDYRKLSEQEFGAGLSEVQTAFIFVHGFNVPFKTAAMRAAQLKVDAKFDGQPIIYSWPTKHFAITDLRGDNYDESRENARASRDEFREFIDIVRANTDAAVVHIIAHSMGNYMMMDVLADLNEEQGADDAPYFGEIILAAPDIDSTRFKSLSTRMVGLGTGMTLYASSKDLAMEISLNLCRSQGRTDCNDRAGFVPEDGPVIANRVDTIDVSKLDETFFDSLADFGHSYFGGDTTVINDIQTLLDSGQRPPQSRNSALSPIGQAPELYWRYQ